MYLLINNISRNDSDNPLPEGSDVILSEMFVDYLMNKITPIWDDLAGCTKYQPQNPIEFTMVELQHVDYEEVKKIITAMQIKQCELDAVPTIIIKRILDEILSIIIYSVNTSLL